MSASVETANTRIVSGAGAASADAKPNALPHHPTFKRRLLLFLFGSKHDINSRPSLNTAFLRESINVAPSKDPRATQLMSPITSPGAEHESSNISGDSVAGQDGGSEPDIFERSILDSGQCHPVPKCSKCSTTRSRLCTHNSSILVQGGQFLKQEDCIPAALDATASILSDKETNLDDVEMVYSNRRNSSVIGLNMALGRSYTPTRKNSMYSMTSLQQQAQHPSYGQLAQQHAAAPSNPQFNSPPKLKQSKLSVSFYSYADMINKDEHHKRPSMMSQSQSQLAVPTYQSMLSQPAFAAPNVSNSSNSTTSGLGRHYSLSRQSTGGLERSSTNTLSSHFLNLTKQILKLKPKQSMSQLLLLNKKSLILPESSDNEETTEFNPSPVDRHASVSSARSHKSGKSNASLGLIEFEDAESFVSTSMADCLRRTQTELNTS